MVLVVPGIPGGPELLVLILVPLLWIAIAVVVVRVALVFIDHPESVEIRNRVALLEHEVAELEERLDELDDEQ